MLHDLTKEEHDYVVKAHHADIEKEQNDNGPTMHVKQSKEKRIRLMFVSLNIIFPYCVQFLNVVARCLKRVKRIYVLYVEFALV